LDDFKDLKFVGQGNFSEIFSAIEIKDGRKYAIKKISKRRLS
jgi:serine/threonine protein kinase